jgi:hypothetical protein
MLRAGRPEDPKFGHSEALYRRVDPEDIVEGDNGRKLVAHSGQRRPWGDGISISVARGKYAEPDDARWESAYDPHNYGAPQLYRDWYVTAVAVADLPSTIASVGGAVHTFKPEHAPFDDLYAHSEITAFKNGEKIMQSSQFNKSAKVAYRAALSNRTVIVRQPDEI